MVQNIFTSHVLLHSSIFEFIVFLWNLRWQAWYNRTLNINDVLLENYFLAFVLVFLNVFDIIHDLLFFYFQVESFILDQEELDESDASRFLLSHDTIEGAEVRTVDPETQAKLEALLEAAGEYCIVYMIEILYTSKYLLQSDYSFVMI